jgi:energy-coupling factor transporter ATP-binding protein EcfA2
LQDFDTFKQLIKNSPNPDQIRYPQLVSFIGETSAGKSTLIKMLIEYDQAKYEANKSMFKAPVPGSPLHDSTPTSADVHLYVDPATWEEERPIFYADCEGLNAGERIPIGAHSRRQTKTDTSRKLGLRARSLEWATSDQTRTRQYAVTQLYPRLLYTFSDVVVFVLNNPK